MNVSRIAGFSFDNKGGNPAGVLITKTMLDESEMLNIAKEINYSETAFLVPLENNRFRIRYFAPEMEIGFCGHATIASGYEVAKNFGCGDYEFILNEGSVQVNIAEVDETFITSITSIKTSSKPIRSEIVDEIIKHFNFSLADVDENYPIKIAYSGNNHLIIFLKQKATLENMQYDFEPVKALVREHEITTISLLYRENETLFHSRNPFAYGGVYEDPATGSAAVALGEYLRDNNIIKNGEIEILQGVDMQVPSKLYAKFDAEPNSPIVISGESRVINEDN